MNISRSEALIFASFIKMVNFTEEKLAQELESAILENNSNDESLDQNFILRRYVESQFSRYTNDYISGYLKSNLKREINIIGRDIDLYTCSCCEYKTLERKGEYDICEVCFWEDDGSDDENILSNVNHMTLRNAKENFNKYGVVDNSFLKNAEEDRIKKFRR